MQDRKYGEPDTICGFSSLWQVSRNSVVYCELWRNDSLE